MKLVHLVISAAVLTACASTPVIKKFPEFQRSKLYFACVQQMPVTMCECIEKNILNNPSMNQAEVIPMCMQEFSFNNPGLLQPQ